MKAYRHRVGARNRFLLRHGVVPWGLAAGVAAAALAAIGTAGGTDSLSLPGRVVLCVVCFAVWTLLVGWVVGGFRWAVRRPERKAGRAPRRRRDRT